MPLLLTQGGKMMLMLVLMGVVSWNKEIVDITEDSLYMDPFTEGIKMLFDVKNGGPVLIYPTNLYTVWQMAEKSTGSWIVKPLPFTEDWCNTWAFDDNGVLAGVKKGFYAKSDSIMIYYYPDVNDTTRYTKLDSMQQEATPNVSNIVFRDTLPLFFYTGAAIGPYYKDAFMRMAQEDASGDWHISLVDSVRMVPGDAGMFYVEPIVGIGPGNVLNLLYAQGNAAEGGSLRLAKNAGLGWTIETLDSAQNIPGMSAKSFAVDEYGYVHVLHSHDFRVFYMTNKSGGWTTDTLDVLKGYTHMAYCWLSLMPWGLPHGIASERSAAGFLISHYFYNDGSTWHHDTVPYVSWFDIDRWGNPHIMAIDTLYYQPPDTVFHYWLSIGIEEPAPVTQPEYSALDVSSVTNTVRISYSLPQAQEGTVAIYEASGRRVEENQVRGSGETEFKSVLPPGVYFVKLTTENKTLTRKAVLVR